MRLNRENPGKTDIQIDPGVLLRGYIEEGIKTLYLNRKHLFYKENREYEKLKETYQFLTEKIRELAEKSPKMIVPGENNYSFLNMNGEIAEEICNYMNFILMAPPNNFRLKPRVKRYAIIGKMRVPALDFLLLTFLDFKIPRYWADNVASYYSASLAIIKIIARKTSSHKIVEISTKIKMPDKNSEDLAKIDDFDKKITQWIRLGLIG
jgi:hypothetical protein